MFFALESGTIDSIVYDTVLEETGDSAAFERQIGRNRLANSAALVSSALVGGVLAGVAGTRITYLLTVPSRGVVDRRAAALLRAASASRGRTPPRCARTSA